MTKDANDIALARGSQGLRQVFDETIPQPIEPAGHNLDAGGPPAISATPYRWVDPAKVPPREWLYDRHLIRRFLSVDVAAGAVGKSSLIIVEALSIATGRGLLTGKPTAPARVWIWNGEDPLVEMTRRIQAACLHYGITPADIEGRLFVDTGRKMPIVIAREDRGGLTIAEPVVEAVKRTIKENQIDVFWVDPFVRSHRVPENDNGQINAVAEAWAEIADVTNTAIDLVHHLKKTGGNEISSEDARGKRPCRGGPVGSHASPYDDGGGAGIRHAGEQAPALFPRRRRRQVQPRAAV